MIFAGPSGNHIIYEAETLFECEKSTPTITCIFKNRLNQTRNATITVRTIQGMYLLKGQEHLLCPLSATKQSTVQFFVSDRRINYNTYTMLMIPKRLKSNNQTYFIYI